MVKAGRIVSRTVGGKGVPTAYGKARKAAAIAKWKGSRGGGSRPRPQKTEEQRRLEADWKRHGGRRQYERAKEREAERSKAVEAAKAGQFSKETKFFYNPKTGTKTYRVDGKAPEGYGEITKGQYKAIDKTLKKKVERLTPKAGKVDAKQKLGLTEQKKTFRQKMAEAIFRKQKKQVEITPRGDIIARKAGRQEIITKEGLTISAPEKAKISPEFVLPAVKERGRVAWEKKYHKKEVKPELTQEELLQKQAEKDYKFGREGEWEKTIKGTITKPLTLKEKAEAFREKSTEEHPLNWLQKKLAPYLGLTQAYSAEKRKQRLTRDTPKLTKVKAFGLGVAGGFGTAVLSTVAHPVKTAKALTPYVVSAALLGPLGVFGYLTGKSVYQQARGKETEFSKIGKALSTRPAESVGQMLGYGSIIGGTTKFYGKYGVKPTLEKMTVPQRGEISTIKGGGGGKLKVTTVEPDKTVWKGLGVEWRTRGKPLIGITDKKLAVLDKKIGFAKWKPKKSDLEVDFSKADLSKGYIVETPVQTHILRKSFGSFVSKAPFLRRALKWTEEKLRFEKGLEIMRKTETVKSRYVQKQFIKETKSLKPQGVQQVLDFAKKNKAEAYGSFTARPQIPERLWKKYRGASRPADIDLQLTGSQEDAIILAQKLAEQLKSSGHMVRISKETPTLIETKIKGTWHHAVDIHSAEPSQAELVSPALAQERIYGLKLNQPSIKIEKTKVMPLSEFGLRKGGSILTLRTGGFAPAPHRLKDVADFFMAQETLAKSKMFGQQKLLSKIRLLKRHYPEAELIPGGTKILMYTPSKVRKPIPEVSSGAYGLVEKPSPTIPSPSVTPSPKISPSKPVSPNLSQYLWSPSPSKPVSVSPKPSPSISPSKSVYPYKGSPSPYYPPSPSPPSYISPPSPKPSPSPSPPSPYYPPSPLPSPVSPSPSKPSPPSRDRRFLAYISGRRRLPRGRATVRQQPSTQWTITNPLRDLPAEYAPDIRQAITREDDVESKIEKVKKWIFSHPGQKIPKILLEGISLAAKLDLISLARQLQPQQIFMSQPSYKLPRQPRYYPRQTMPQQIIVEREKPIQTIPTINKRVNIQNKVNELLGKRSTNEQVVNRVLSKKKLKGRWL